MAQDPTEPEGAAPRRRAVATAGLLIVASLVAIALYAWFSFGDMAMSTSGYIALALGIAGTMALAIGLMTLVYFSHRQGYDARTGTGKPKEREERRGPAG
jgi:hypothetical protein